MTNGALAPMEIEARLVAKGWDVLNMKAVRFVVLIIDLQMKSPSNEKGEAVD
jgi:hypothetical protein